ncbi:MerR family transcriptional regulator [Bifidobacterium sp. ESL0763]|uniref:MerR family transcriptional regulator n=1 Tax=Bifidobacterium sp. ESL0763 TaxID=2983227 RepID=UPI0023F7BC48|nr:MerR family transcriptional regulator [Bifidobacterium sp. ESL0763]MDF7664281.1 MerR family transcriptional regulator [Bifidobacterium sp. ESL0763]
MSEAREDTGEVLTGADGSPSNMTVVHPLREGKSVKETARIYGISADTLYYYERQGILTPRRNPYNSYRVYGSEDFFKLNIITELRSLGFSIEKTARYLKHQDFKSTLELTSEELESINRQIDELSEHRAAIHEELTVFLSSLSDAQTSLTTFEHYDERSFELVSNDLVYDKDLPYTFAKYSALSKRERLKALRSIPAYVVDVTQLADDCFPAKKTLLYTGDANPKTPYILPAGLYAGRTFKGSFPRCPEIYQQMARKIAEKGYAMCGDPIEYCLIGDYESADQSEHVTRMEIPVRETAKGKAA